MAASGRKKQPKVRALADTARTGHVQSVHTALRILGCFDDHDELGPTDVAPMLGISSSSASRAMITMATDGFLERTRCGRYRLGLRLFTLGQLSISRLRLREFALPLLAEVRDSLDETAQIGMPMGADVLYLDRLESRHGLWLHSEEYRQLPAAVSGTGRAIAAFNPAFQQAIEASGLKPRFVTPYTVTDKERFRAALDEIRAQGWACLKEETVLGVTSIAAPVLVERAGEKYAVAAISVVGPTGRVAGRLQRVVVRTVCGAAKKLALSLRTYHAEQGWTA